MQQSEGGHGYLCDSMSMGLCLRLAVLHHLQLPGTWLRARPGSTLPRTNALLGWEARAVKIRPSKR